MAEFGVGCKLQRVASQAVCCVVLAACAQVLPAEDPPAAKPPRIALFSPLGVQPGQKNRITLRGWSLKEATAVVADSDGLKITVVSHATAPIPAKQKAEQIGDEQLELDIEVPADHTTRQVQVVVRTAAGESAPRPLPIGSSLPVLQEQEPNDGFRNAQSVSIPQLITGSIHADANVDVFAFELSQPACLQIRVEAAALGSNLDALLTLLTADGSILAGNDDNRSAASPPAQRDSQLQVNLQPGRYLVTLQDAQDRGGPAHPYQLTLQHSQIDPETPAK
jgi:hypothetical protein